MAYSKRNPVAYEVERAMRTIFKRCVECPPGTPSCPDCAANEICSLVPQDCNQCARTTCTASTTLPNAPPQNNSGPNVGAIAGGVVAGIAAVGIAVFLLWFFYIRKRRLQQELEAEQWEDDIAQHKSRHFSQMQTDAASTRTRASLATSILSRASNIIQIAYIPGITNRNGGSGHDTPVPPIPAAFRTGTPNSPKTPLSGNGEALFFRPSDLRDSVASSFVSARSRGNNRDTQYTMKSITPSLARSSIASDIYHDDATAEPMPATTVVRGLPRMVSVKTSKSHNSSSDSSPATTPPVPQGPQVMIPGSGAATTVRGKATPTFISKGNAIKGRFPVKRAASNAGTAPAVSSPLVDAAEDAERASSDDEDEHARARKSLLIAAKPATDQQSVDSPFYDASEAPPKGSSSPKMNPYATMASSIGHTKQGSKNFGGLSAVIEEATKRASEAPSHSAPSSKRDSSPSSSQQAGDILVELDAAEKKEAEKEKSPFSDEHATE